MPKPISLKKTFMEAGNRLVTEHSFDPAMIPQEELNRLLESYGNSTVPLMLVSEWINRNPEVRLVLEELGFNWEMSAETS